MSILKEVFKNGVLIGYDIDDNTDFIKIDDSDKINGFRNNKDNIFISLKEQMQNNLILFIYSKYPQPKQSSDLADKLYFENALKAKGVKTLEKTIVTKITAFNDGKTFDEILDGVADENKEAMAQLLKVGIRISWVQACKSELKTAIAENREPVYPEFPEI